MHTQILLVDDHKVFSNSLKFILEENNFHVNVSPCANTALIYLESLTFDLMIVDLAMPKITGYDLIKEVLENKKRTPPKIIVLTSNKNAYVFKKLYTLGIDGYLSKNVSRSELLKAINSVINNDKHYESVIYNDFLNNSSKKNDVSLTQKEQNVLRLILNEMTSSEIADELKISFNTVEDYRKKLMQKTKSKNVVGLVKYSFENNLF